jgi:hypothetical protein
MEVNIMPWNIVYTLLGNVMLRPSDKLLKSCPFGHILKCREVACVVPLLVDKVKVNLDFHIFDVLDLDLLLGSPAERHGYPWVLIDQGPGGPCQVDPTCQKPCRPASGPGDLIYNLGDIGRPRMTSSRPRKTCWACGASFSQDPGASPPVGLRIAGSFL